MLSLTIKNREKIEEIKKRLVRNEKILLNLNYKLRTYAFIKRT